MCNYHVSSDDPTFDAKVRGTSTRSSEYETRNMSTRHSHLGSSTSHIALDQKGNPFVLNPRSNYELGFINYVFAK